LFRRKKKMKPKKYSTHYAKLSNLILSMPEERQAKLLDLASRMKNSENLFANNGRKNSSLYFSYGVLAGWGLITILLLIFSAT
jgi:hypothetical protein